MVFSLMWTIVFDTMRALGLTNEGGVFPLLVILIPENIRVYICFSYASNETAYVEASVNKTLILISILNILYVHSYNYYV